MTPQFSVRTTAHFDRLLKKLCGRHPDLPEIFAAAVIILQADPLNRSRCHSIKKLQGVAPGEGQYRLRLGRWRFRYDIWDLQVHLSYCGLRREDTYTR